jgi:hypothetical protein
MRTFTVTCPECDCDLDVEIEEADLADLETNHTVVCEECHTETEYAYDPVSDELVPVDEEDDDEDTEEDDDEDDPLIVLDEDEATK